VSLAVRRRTDAERRSLISRTPLAGIARAAGVHLSHCAPGSSWSTQRLPVVRIPVRTVPRRRTTLSRPGLEPRSAALSSAPPAPGPHCGSGLVPCPHSAHRPVRSQSSSRPPTLTRTTVLFASLVVVFSHRRRTDTARTPLLLRSTRSRRRPPSALALLSSLARHSPPRIHCRRRRITRPRTKLTRSDLTPSASLPQLDTRTVHCVPHRLVLASHRHLCSPCCRAS